MICERTGCERGIFATIEFEKLPDPIKRRTCKRSEKFDYHDIDLLGDIWIATSLTTTLRKIFRQPIHPQIRLPRYHINDARPNI